MRRNLLVRARATLHRIEAEEAREVSKRIKWLADRAAFAKKYAVTRSTPRGRNWFRGSYGGGIASVSIWRAPFRRISVKISRDPIANITSFVVSLFMACPFLSWNMVLSNSKHQGYAAFSQTSNPQLSVISQGKPEELERRRRRALALLKEAGIILEDTSEGIRWKKA